MYTKITAEFASVDAAELAARAIKHNIDDVSKISIHSKNIGAFDDDSRTGILSPYNVEALNFSGTYFPVSSGAANINPAVNSKGNYNYSDVEYGTEAIIEVYGNDAAIKETSRLLTGLGGLKIHRE
ncbi:MAG: hypothetical protein GX988_02650 [Clostridiales bacterium]|nr:hypothetical protein [Clostridiales bacterium]